MNLIKFSKILFVVLSILSIIFLVGIMASAEMDSWAITPFIWLSIIVLVFSIILTLMFSFKSMAADKAKMKSSLKGMGVLVGIFVVSYLIGDKEPSNIGGIEVSSFKSGMISAGLNTFYILAVIAIGLMIYFNVVKSKK
jgi:hypothetical protein